MTKIEKIGLCGGGVCTVTAIVGAIVVSPLFLAFIPIGLVVINTCNLRKKTK